MALSENQQALELIKKNRSILIVFKKDYTGDALTSALALSEALKKMDRQVDLVCQDFKPTSNLKFLPTTEVKNKIGPLRQFIVSIDTSLAPLEDFTYEKKDNRFDFFLTPLSGEFSTQDISASYADYKYDLIIIINSPDLESLGEAYFNNADFFYNTPKINIDNSNGNEYFGDINLVNLTAAATAEIVYEMIGEMDSRLIDEDIATYLLAGIIMATKNFKTANLTPKTLHLASLLNALGARREQIIRALYQSRYLSTLKLWGRVLARLNNDLNDRIVWSTISTQDFLETSTTPEEIVDVVDELIVSMPKTEIVVLLYEKRLNGSNTINALIYSIKNINAVELVQRFNPEGNKEFAKFELTNTSLPEAEREVIGEIRKKLV